MPEPPTSARFRRALSFIAILLALLVGIGSAQTTSQPAETPKQVPGAGIAVQDQPQSAPQAQPNPPPTPPAQAAEPEASGPITKAQAKELFRSVDEILQFASRDTGLPIKHKVKRKLITRDQVEKYVEKRMKGDKDTRRLEREQLVLVKFGLIPSDYDLHAEFVKLLSEQVAAYYDSKTKTVNLLDWVQPDLQRPVLAHELTHALQDQAVDIQKWARAGAPDDKPLPDQREQVVEEAQAARQNVTEGQAMLVMLDYTLAPAGLSVLKAPDVVNAMRAAMTSGQDSPVLSAAPVFLQESLMMPYTFGLDFVRAVLTKQGKEATYAGMLEHPPVDTLQVMVPENYLEDKVTNPPVIPDLDKLIAPDYERYDFGGIGAFDIFLLTRQYEPKSNAKQHYPHWRGGYYLAGHLKFAPKNQIALLFFTRWDSPEAAREFAQMYSDYTPTRYHSPAGNTGGAGSGTGDRSFSWPQEEVAIQVHENDVLVLEGWDDPTRQRLSAAVLPGLQPAR
ncbi:MAG TPA: hypothetical protein VMU45_14925 [Candidatus Eisenbacteria bacterium]|nr:hypothetical protein [Candidatus Eisenbacteria bacterium]